MTRWGQLEEWLFDQESLDFFFTADYLAEQLGVSTPESSKVIQAYLAAQTSERSNTLFVLRRTGRGRKAQWHAGIKAVDAHGIHAQAADDFMRRYERYIQPSLTRIGDRNPRARKVASALAVAIEANLEVLAAIGEE